MKIIHNTQSARLKLKSGVNQLNEIVKHTLGPTGKCIALSYELLEPQVLDDGHKIAKEVELDDVAENLGCQLARKSAEETNRLAGDGTTTSIVLTNALVNEMVDDALISKSYTKDELIKDKETIIKYLDEHKTEVKTPEQVKSIATISSGDAEIGEIISKIYQELGNDVVITIQTSKKSGISHESSKGLEITTGNAIWHEGTQKLNLLECPVITLEGSIEGEDLIKIADALKGKYTQAVILADNFSEQVLDSLIAQQTRGFYIIPIKAPYFAERRTGTMGDIAMLTGGKLVNIKNFKPEDIGICKRVETTKNKTIFINDNNLAVEDRALTIRDQINTSESDFEIAQLKERLARLMSGVAIIKVGMPTETETRNKMEKIDDAIHAVRVAIEDGVVEGGGLALLQAANALNPTSPLFKAIKAPYDQICENMGVSSLTSDPNVIDPVKVTKTALNNAVSIAWLIYCCEGLVAWKKNPKEVSD